MLLCHGTKAFAMISFVGPKTPFLGVLQGKGGLIEDKLNTIFFGGFNLPGVLW